jgi:hypothetical protein
MKTHLQLSIAFLKEGLREKFYARPKNHILISAMPKSGSTYLTNIVSTLINCKSVNLAHLGSNREQELDRVALMLNNKRNYVAKAHIKNSAVTNQYSDYYNLKKIVLIRNLHDVVMSLYDHLNNRDEATKCPMANFSLEMREWNREKCLLYIARHFVPWYVSFYLSWKDADDILLINYHELVSDFSKSISNIINFIGLNFSSDYHSELLKSVNEMDNRKNIGISGRGRDLPKSVKQEIFNVVNSHLGLGSSDKNALVG